MLHKTAELPLESHTIVVPYADEPGLKERDIHVNMVTVEGQTPSTLVEMGLGNEGRAPYMAQKHMMREGIIDTAFLEGLPYARIDPNRLRHFGVAATHAASQHLSERNGGERTSLIPESQAGLPGIWAFKDNPDAYDRIDTLHPLGFVQLTPGQFAGRLLLTGFQRDQWSDPRSLYVGGISAGRAIQDVCRGGARLDFALNVKAVDDWAHIVEERPEDAAMYLNKRDKLFPELEVLTTIQGVDLTRIPHATVAAMRSSVQIIDGSHSSPATKAGARQVVHIVNKNKSSRESSNSGDKPLTD